MSIDNSPQWRAFGIATILLMTAGDDASEALALVDDDADLSWLELDHVRDWRVIIEIRQYLEGML